MGKNTILKKIEDDYLHEVDLAIKQFNQSTEPMCVRVKEKQRRINEAIDKKKNSLKNLSQTIDKIG